MQDFYCNHFNDLYSTGFQGLGSRYFHKKIETLWENSSPSRVLEVGAYGGGHFPYLRIGKPEATTFHALDLQKNRIRQNFISLKNGDLAITWKVGDICKSKLKSDSYDRIVSTCVLAHVDDPYSALFEMRRLLTNGGEISIGLPSDPGILNRAIKRIYSFPRGRKAGLEEMSLLNALEHKNSIFGLKAMIDFIFKGDDTTWKYFPTRISAFDLNLFAVFHAKKIG